MTLSNEQILKLLNDLDDIGRDRCEYDYGLPLHETGEDDCPLTALTKAVKDWIYGMRVVLFDNSYESDSEFIGIFGSEEEAEKYLSGLADTKLIIDKHNGEKRWQWFDGYYYIDTI